MATISLDDLDDKPKKKKKKIKVTAKSDAKPAKKVKTSTAKKAKTVSVGKKSKKNKSQPLDLDMNLDTVFDDLPAPKKKNLPAAPEEMKQADILEGQLMSVVAAVPATVQRDNEQFVEYLQMFKQCQNIARAIEERFEDRKSPRDVYPLMKIYEQMREIIADLRAIKDVTELGEVINEEVIGPMVENVATILIGFHQSILAWNNSNLDANQIASAKHTFDQLLGKSAKEVEQAYHSSLDKMMQIFAAEQ